jgi:hypothetical protein
MHLVMFLAAASRINLILTIGCLTIAVVGITSPAVTSSFHLIFATIRLTLCLLSFYFLITASDVCPLSGRSGCRLAMLLEILERDPCWHSEVETLMSTDREEILFQP